MSDVTGHDDRDYIELDLPSFDEKSLRRAVRRGVFRTAVDVVVLLFVASFLIRGPVIALVSATGREDYVNRVIETGLRVAHPDYREVGYGCCNVGLTSISTGPALFEALSPQFRSNSVEVDARLSLWGLGTLNQGSASLPQTTLGDVIHSGGLSHSGSRSILEGLPTGVLASAVVWFRQPLDQSDLDPVVSRMGIGQIDTPILFDVPGPARAIGWPTPNIAEFQSWTQGLSPSDDRNLRALELPSSATLKTIPSSGVKGIVIAAATRAQLLRWLDEPLVLSVNPAEVVFNVGIGTPGASVGEP